MATEDDQVVPLTLESLRPRLHKIADGVVALDGRLIKAEALIERLDKRPPDASQLRFTSGVMFTIVMSALAIAGMLWKVGSDVNNLALETRMNFTITTQRTDQLEKAVEEEKRQRTLSDYDLRTAMEKKGR
jgi:hypothetical protein